MRHAYRRRAQQLHPDHLHGAGAPELTESLQATARLNYAWEVLSDRDRRAAYDAQRRPAEPLDPDDGRRVDEPIRVGRRVSMLPWLVLAAVMVAIFVFTAYAGPSTAPASQTRPGGAGITTATSMTP
jgi:curved DNA-binding protein CbpA